MKKIILLGLFAVLLATSTLAVTYTDNGDSTGNYCWNNVPDAKAERMLDAIVSIYADRYFQFNETFTINNLTNGQKLNGVFDPVTRGFWNEKTYAEEKDETLRLAKIAFDQSYLPPFGE